jgi:hypothetical protein
MTAGSHHEESAGSILNYTGIGIPVKGIVVTIRSTRLHRHQPAAMIDRNRTSNLVPYRKAHE